MIVRDAVVADATAIADVHVETWRAAYAHALPAAFLDSLDATQRERMWRGAIERGDTVLVADTGGSVVGFAAVGPSDEAEGLGEFYAIYVRPTAWGVGAGRELMTAGLHRLRAAGFSAAVLWVLEDNPRARRFYECAGWGPEGRKLDVVGGVEVGEVRYRIDLRAARARGNARS